MLMIVLNCFWQKNCSDKHSAHNGIKYSQQMQNVKLYSYKNLDNLRIFLCIVASVMLWIQPFNAELGQTNSRKS
jgi:hypothetical protein